MLRFLAWATRSIKLPFFWLHHVTCENLSSPTRDWIQAHSSESPRLNDWTTKEFSWSCHFLTQWTMTAGLAGPLRVLFYLYVNPWDDYYTSEWKCQMSISCLILEFRRKSKCKNMKLEVTDVQLIFKALILNKTAYPEWKEGIKKVEDLKIRWILKIKDRDMEERSRRPKVCINYEMSDSEVPWELVYWRSLIYVVLEPLRDLGLRAPGSHRGRKLSYKRLPVVCISPHSPGLPRWW